MTPSKIIINIPVLYGSQTGNSEAAAIQLASLLPQQLSNDKYKITSKALQLDDFLEMEGCKWTRIFIVITSSYGVGQAPLGCWKFRQFCDFILDNTDKAQEKKEKHITYLDTLLEGCYYSLLGLGDSKYTTFFLNPTALDLGLSKLGATRFGALGKADASGKVPPKPQGEVIDEWTKGIHKHIESVVREIEAKCGWGDDDEVKDMKLKQSRTVSICQDIFDDWNPALAKKQKNDATMNFMVIAVPVILAILFYFLKK